jgi:hypothetical protein
MVPRLNVRTMMCIVAFIGLALGLAAHAQRRAQAFRDLAAYHWRMAFLLRNEALGFAGLIASHHPGPDPEALAHSLGPKNVIAYNASKYHDGLATKYSAAADRPRLPVQADPPTPYGYHWKRPSDAGPRGWSDPYDSDIGSELK